MTVPYWAVVRTHPNCEGVAIHNLERQSFNYYQPTILERKKKLKGYKLVKSPLFPCYLFVEIASRWVCLQSTYGVSSVILAGAQPAKVPIREIESLREREDSNGCIALPTSPWRQGDTVCITDGAFGGQLARIVRAPARDRSKFLLALLFKGFKIEASEGQFSAA